MALTPFKLNVNRLCIYIKHLAAPLYQSGMQCGLCPELFTSDLPPSITTNTHQFVNVCSLANVVTRPLSNAFRYSTSCSMEIIFSPCWSANLRQSSRRAIVPSSSSFTTSQRSAAWSNPVNLHKSERPKSVTSFIRKKGGIDFVPSPASVCPVRSNTPPSRARKGHRWPGRLNSFGRVAGDASFWAVSARS